MFRTRLTATLATLVLFGAAGSAAALSVTPPSQQTVTPPTVEPADPPSATKPSPTITVTGQLQVVTSYGAPHYTVANYILIHSDQKLLASLAGQEVVVAGTEFTGPSIYMQKAINVTRIERKNPSSDDGGSVTIPVITDPAIPLPAPPSSDVTKPVPLVPLHGTSRHVLFGQVKADEAGFYLGLTDDRAVRVTSDKVDLEAVLGERIGAVVETNEGTVTFEIVDAVTLSGDLRERLETGTTLMYQAPAEAITIKLRGEAVEMDQAPILGNGRALVGLRAIAEALGARVHWDGTTQTASVSLGARQVIVTVGSSEVIVRQANQPDVVITNDIAPVIVSQRTMVPARVLSEGLGLHVHWNQETLSVELH